MSELSLGIGGALGSACTWALICVLAQSLSIGLTSAGINGFRALVGGLIVLAAAVTTGYGRELVTMPLWVALGLWVSAVIGYAGGDTIFFLGMQRMGVTRAHTLGMVHPLMSTLAGVVLFGEAMSAARATGILLVVGGTGLIVLGHPGSELDAARSRRHGIGLVLTAAVAWTVGAVMLKPPLDAVSPITATAFRNPLVGLSLFLLPWSRGTWRAVQKTRGRQALILAAICLLSAASPVLYTFGIKHAGVGIGTVLSTTSPLFTIPLEIAVLGKRPSGRTIIGAVTTVAGIALMN